MPRRYTQPMRPIRTTLSAAVASMLIATLCSQPAFAWGRDGHMMINRLAAANLPADVPVFLRNKAALDTMEYLGPEPDRWKSRAEQELSDTQSPDHFLDYEWAILAATPCTSVPAPAPTPAPAPPVATASPSPSAVPPAPCVAGYRFPKHRYDFIRSLAATQPQHPELKLQENVGFQPWQVEEVWQRLKADLREYRHLVDANADTAPVQLAILFDAGWLGHYVADGSQPLHITIQYNGWTGPNPNGYTTAHKIHSQFESIYVTANVKAADLQPLVAAAAPQVIADEWSQYLDYIHHTNGLVEKTYQLEKAGAFTAAGTPEGKVFATERLAAGAIELRDLIYSAWVHSADPVEEFKGPQ